MEQIPSEESSSCKTWGSHNSVDEDSSLWEYEFSMDMWLILANDKALYPMFLLPLKIEKQISPKCWYVCIQVHGMTSQKAVMCVQQGVVFIYGFHCTANKPK